MARRAKQIFIRIAKPIHLKNFACKRLDNPHSRQRFFGNRSRIAQPILHRARQLADALSKIARPNSGNRRSGKHHQTQSPIENNHSPYRANSHNPRHQNLRNRPRRGISDRPHIIGQPRHELAQPVIGIKAKPQNVQMCIDLLSQIRHHALTHPGNPVMTAHVQKRLKHKKHQHAQRQQIQLMSIPLLKHRIQ